MKDHRFLMNLPSHIMVDILSRLPVKSIIHCKCVCKTWLDIISGFEFITLHLSRSIPCLVVHQSEMYKNFLKLVDFEDSIDHHGLKFDPVMKFDLRTLSSFHDSNIVMDGSINGFIFLRDANYKHETLYICNPVTREYVTLPRPKGVVRYPSIITHGFGVSAKSDQYKVVRISHELPFLKNCNSECRVYTLGKGSWRSIGQVQFAHDSNSTGLFFEGNLHWLIEDLEQIELISCFDLEKEIFQPFPPPFPSRKIQGSLGVLKGCLCLCDNTSDFDIVIWVMKEYGVNGSWSKEFVIRKIPEIAGPSREVVHALKVFRDGVVLLVWGDFCMLYYCGKSKFTREVDMAQPRGPNSIEAMHHVSSFVSLRRFGMENVSTF